MTDAAPDANDSAYLQQSIRELVDKKKQILTRLSGGRGRGRGRGGGTDRARFERGTRSTGGDEAQSPSSANATVPRVVSVSDGGGESKLEEPASPASPGEKKRGRSQDREVFPVDPDLFQVEKRPKLEPDRSAVKRNRNLFGNLLGHLKKAKDGLEKEKASKQAEMHKKQEERVDGKLVRERKNLEELRRREVKVGWMGEFDIEGRYETKTCTDNKLVLFSSCCRIKKKRTEAP
eukprot:GHVN01097111.1.p1 GENE.GHVN01097111.1~~GHVN01097111.1.p1  ORF type:complete len:234 (+),score=43.18 GHVN01097111.1:807-1508(+)